MRGRIRAVATIQYAEGTDLAKAIINALRPYLNNQDAQHAAEAVNYAEPLIGAMMALEKAVYDNGADLPRDLKTRIRDARWGYTPETQRQLPLIEYALNKSALPDIQKRYPGFTPAQARELVAA